MVRLCGVSAVVVTVADTFLIFFTKASFAVRKTSSKGAKKVNPVGITIQIVACLELLGGIVGALTLSQSSITDDFAGYVFFGSLFVAILLLGFSEVIRLLNKISNSLEDEDSSISNDQLPKL